MDNRVLILRDDKNVSVNNVYRTIQVVDNNRLVSPINVIQEVTNVIQVTAGRVKGDQGDQGPSGSFPTSGSYYLNGSISSSFTGSYTGSFFGDGAGLTGIISSKWTGSGDISRLGNVSITGSFNVSGSLNYQGLRFQLLKSDASIDFIGPGILLPSRIESDIAGNLWFSSYGSATTGDLIFRPKYTERFRITTAGVQVTGTSFLKGNTEVTGSFKVTGSLNIGNAASLNQRIVRIGQDTSYIDIGSWVGGSSFGAIYFTTPTPSATNFTILGDGINSWWNAPAGTGVLRFGVAQNYMGTFTSTGLILGGGIINTTTRLLIEENTTGISSFRITPSSAVEVASPTEGDVWHNGTYLKWKLASGLRIGSTPGSGTECIYGPGSLQFNNSLYSGGINARTGAGNYGSYLGNSQFEVWCNSASGMVVGPVNAISLGLATNNIVRIAISSSGEIKIPLFEGSGSRILQTDFSGSVSAPTEIIEQWLVSGSTMATNLSTPVWWSASIYTGSAITGTFKGQQHNDNSYLYIAIDDNVWKRVAFI